MISAALAGRFEPHVAVGLGQPQDAETGAEALLGVRLGAHDRLDQGGRGRPDLRRLATASAPASTRRSADARSACARAIVVCRRFTAERAMARRRAGRRGTSRSWCR